MLSPIVNKIAWNIKMPILSIMWINGACSFQRRFWFASWNYIYVHFREGRHWQRHCLYYLAPNIKWHQTNIYWYLDPFSASNCCVVLPSLSIYLCVNMLTFTQFILILVHFHLVFRCKCWSHAYFIHCVQNKLYSPYFLNT